MAITLQTPLAWKHEDPRGLNEAIKQATARASAREWSSDGSAVSKGTRAADLRALALASAYFASHFDSRTGGPIIKGSSLTIPLDPSGAGTVIDADRDRLSRALRSSVMVLADMERRSSPPAAGLLARVQTTGGEAATALGTPATDAGAIPILVAALVIGGTVAVYCFVAQKAAEVVDHQLARRTEAQAAADAASKLVDLADKHADAEQAAGRPLPMNDAQRAAVSALSQQTNALAAGEAARGPISNPFDIGASGGFSLGVVAAAAAFLFVIVKGKNHGFLA